MKKICSLLFLLTLVALIINPFVFADDMGKTTTQNMAVSAILYPQPADYQFSLVQQDGGTTVNNGKYYAYTITYGAKRSASFNTANTIITFDWGRALGPNNQNMFDYVYGSASDAYGGAKPVVDTTNKTISWTIPNLPPGTTDQQLVFQLFTNSYDRTTTAFPLYLTASMTNQYLTMPDQTLTVYYQYQPPPPGPTATPGPKPMETPTPTPVHQPNYYVDITGISDNDATMRITTAKPSKLTIFYGTSPTALTQTVSTDDYESLTTLTLKELTADTPYFFKIFFTDNTGQTSSSEIFTFKTAKQSLQPVVGDNIIVFSSNGTVFFSQTQKQIDMSLPSVILTTGSNYEISYTFGQTFSVKSLALILLNKATAHETTSLMSPKTYALFNADLQAANPGLYDISVRITDSNGNIQEKKIVTLKIIPRLAVYAQDTNTPISDARVFLSYFDKQTNRFLPLSSQLFPLIKNPSYTDATGQVFFTLPAGKYRAEARALFYDKATMDFTIGMQPDQNFPKMYLKKNSFNFISLLTFIKDYLSDTWTKLITELSNLSSSVRLFNIFAVVVLGSFCLLSFLLFLVRSHSKPQHLPIFLLFGFDTLFKRHKQKYIYGRITDEDEEPLSHALIEIEDADTKNIIAQTTSNKLGKFYFRNSFINTVNLLVTKEGFEPSTIQLDNAIPENGLHLTLLKGERHHLSFFAFLLKGFEESLGLLFEVSLVVSLILEIVFFSLYGFAKTTPYLAVSILNILLWLFYVRERSRKPSL